MTTVATARRRSVRCRTTTDEWSALEDEWRRLFDASPSASPGLDYDWLTEWWNVYAENEAFERRVLCVYEGTELIGAAPFYYSSTLGEGRWDFIGSSRTRPDEVLTEYLDLLCQPGSEEDCADLIAAKMLETKEWSSLELAFVCDTSPLLRASIDGPLQAGIRQSYLCPRADLGSGFDAYIARLSANARSVSRRRIREAAALGATLSIAGDAVSRERYFDLLCELHRRRWARDGQTGCFAHPRFLEFHRRICRHWSPDRALLALLSVANQPVAVLYGFVHRSTFHFYQGGVDLATEHLRSPGICAHLLLMQRLAEQGVRTYDFLAGGSDYKMRLATEEVTVATVVAVRASPRRWLAAAAATAGRILTRARATLRKPA